MANIKKPPWLDINRLF